MNNFNNIWKNFLTESTFNEKIPLKDEQTIIKLENKQKLLKEITEDELEHIRRAIDEISPDEMAFDALFDGKMRIILDFPVVDPSTEFGKFIHMWDLMGYTVDWEKGTVSGERILRDTSPEGMTNSLMGALGGTSSAKPRKIQMKIGKWLSKMLEYRTKYNALKQKIKDYHISAKTDSSPESPAGRLSDPDPRKAAIALSSLTGEQIEEALSERELSNYHRLYDYMEMMGNKTSGGVIYGHVAYAEGLQKLIQYWRDNAAYIKKNIDKAKSDQYSIIITRNPIDILRMSDFEDITSCHAPPSRGGGDSYYKCAVAEAHGHGAVAYVAKTDQILENYGEDVTLDQIVDSREFQDDEIFYDSVREGMFGGPGWIEPVSRLRLRQVRYYSADEQASLLAKYGKISDIPDDLGKEEMKALFMRIKRARDAEFNPYDGVQLAVPETRVYGAIIPGFRKRITKWAQENQADQLDGAPRDTSRSYDDKWGDEPWQYGTIDLNSFIKFGGSYEDTPISNLIGQLFGKKAQVSGTPKRDESTEEELDVNLVAGLLERYQNECEEISGRFNEMMAVTTVDGTAVDDGGEGVYIVCEAHITIGWEEDEWKTWPGIEMIGHALEQLQEYGMPWVKSDYPNQFNVRASSYPKTTKLRTLRIDVAPDKILGFGGQEYAYAPDDYNDFCEHVDAEVDEKREPIKFLLTNLFKREGAIEGGGVMHLGYDAMNDNLDLYHWEVHAEEGAEIDEFEFVNFTAHPEVWYADLGATEEQAAQILSDRSYWLEIRRRMVAPAFKNTGMDHYPEMPLDIDLLGIHGTDGESEELNVMFSVHDESSDKQAAVLRNLVEIWDDQDEINRVANEVFRDMLQEKIALSGTEVGSGVGGYAESYKNEEAQLLKIENYLKGL